MSQQFFRNGTWVSAEVARKMRAEELGQAVEKVKEPKAPKAPKAPKEPKVAKKVAKKAAKK